MDVMTLGLWTYPALSGLVALDAVLPLVPSEAAVIAAIAGAGPAGTLVAVALAAAVGAVVGDGLMHLVGRRLGGRPSVARMAARLGGRRIGPATVLAGRLVPGGRTAVAVVAGIQRMPTRRYLAFDAAGAAMWAVLMVLAGRVGSAVTSSLLGQLAIGAGVLALVAGASALVDRRRRGRSEPGELLALPRSSCRAEPIAA